MESSEFSISEVGTIKNPGKFEGEMIYVPYFYEEALAGTDDEGGNDSMGYWMGVVITPEDKAKFPEWLDESDYGIILEESEQGFVSGTVFTKDEYINTVGTLQMEDEEYEAEFGDKED